jgi:hypothetical protein
MALKKKPHLELFFACPLSLISLCIQEGNLVLYLNAKDEHQVENHLLSQKIRPGGKWTPAHCRAQHKIAIIIPYRDREEHLLNFLYNMHALFARQEIDYGVYVIEPHPKLKFNRGVLFNIGFIESNKDGDWQCHAYHDVDLISEDDRTLYTCYSNPIHIAHRINKNSYE